MRNHHKMKSNEIHVPPSDWQKPNLWDLCGRTLREKALSYPTRGRGLLVPPGGRSVWEYLPTYKQQIPFDSVVLLLEIYPTDILVHVQKDSCTRLFIVWIATDGKQPKCPTVQITQVYTAIKQMRSQLQSLQGPTLEHHGGEEGHASRHMPTGILPASTCTQDGTQWGNLILNYKGTRLNIWQGVNLCTCSSSLLGLF